MRERSSPAAQASPTKLLIFAADPSDAARLRLGEEMAKIKKCWRESNHRDQIIVDANTSTQARDLRQQILNARPTIVHFIGHGTGPGGIVLEDEQGRSRVVPTEALADLFRLAQSVVKCVILNSCFSAAQAEEIAGHIPWVIGMSQEIGDRAAIDFAVGFYDALFAGEPVSRAFEFGRNAIQLASLADTVKGALPARDIASPVVAALPEHMKPVLLARGDTAFVFAPRPGVVHVEPGTPAGLVRHVTRRTVIAAAALAGAAAIWLVVRPPGREPAKVPGVASPAEIMVPKQPKALPDDRFTFICSEINAIPLDAKISIENPGHKIVAYGADLNLVGLNELSLIRGNTAERRKNLSEIKFIPSTTRPQSALVSESLDTDTQVEFKKGSPLGFVGGSRIDMHRIEMNA